MNTIQIHSDLIMGDEDDGYRTHSEQYLDRQKEILRDELREEHAALLLDFLYDNRGELASSTARNYARELRFLIQHGYESDGLPDNPEEWESEDWGRSIRRVSRERGIGDGTKRNTCYAARAFVDWSVESPADKEEIDAPTVSHPKIDEENVLKPGEVVHLIESTRTERDAAVLATMYEAALRRTAVVQLDIQDYKTDRFTRLRLPHKEGVKTGQGRERPLNWSSGYLERWLNNHPNPDDPGAPLFCSIRSGRDEGQRLSSHAVYTMLKRTADRSDLDADRVHPHALRHARATAMRKSGNLDKRDIETVMGWVDSTPMHTRYEHTTSTEDAEVTARNMGVDIDADGEHVVKDCPRCNTTLPPGARYCPTCTQRISAEPPEWWQLYTSVAGEIDPVVKKYEAIPSAVPELPHLEIEELERVRDVFLTADMLMYDSEDDRVMIEESSVDVTAFETEEAADRAFALLGDIRDEMVAIYRDSPENLELKSGSIDLESIKLLATDEDLDDG